MGMGPSSSSLLHKLGKLMAWEMGEVELQELVAKDQVRRTAQRNMARVARLAKDKPGSGGRGVVASVVKLEQLGLDPLVCEMIRKSNVALSEAALIQKVMAVRLNESKVESKVERKVESKAEKGK